MKTLFLSSAIILLLLNVAAGADKEIGKIGSIDAGKKEIVVNVKSGTDLKMGDILEVRAATGKIVFEVTFPMQTVTKCKIKEKSKISGLIKGMSVYRYTEEVEKINEPVISDRTDLRRKRVIIEKTRSAIIEGVWKSSDSTAKFRIFTQDGKTAIEGWDSSDNERFKITDIVFEGNNLSFTTIMESTKFTVHHKCIIIDNSKMDVARSGDSTSAYQLIKE